MKSTYKIYSRIFASLLLANVLFFQVFAHLLHRHSEHEHTHYGVASFDHTEEAESCSICEMDLFTDLSEAYMQFFSSPSFVSENISLAVIHKLYCLSFLPSGRAPPVI